MICPSCHREFTPGEEPDPCLGVLPGVFEACCGHGKRHKSYVYFTNGILVRAFLRVEQHDPQRGQYDLLGDGEPREDAAPDGVGELVHEDGQP